MKAITANRLIDGEVAALAAEGRLEPADVDLAFLTGAGGRR